MIAYVIYSTICMGLVLLFYHAILAREKMYQVNRWYLLAGLFFSLVVPYMPIGIADSLLSLGANSEIPQIVSNGIENTNTESDLKAPANATEQGFGEQIASLDWMYPFLLCLYSIVTLFLSVRMIRRLYRMQLKTIKNPATFFKGHKVVLVDEKVVPHTFLKTIFVNKDQYENGKISEEVMIHELIHAKQNHSLDILIVEILKTIWWFNPVLYFYKTAIQVNHEYIADDRVLSTGTDIAKYQKLLLQMRTAKSAHYLSTSLNFKITKQRFMMMTLKDSRSRSFLKTALIIPFFLILGITFGCEPASTENDILAEKITVELVDSETIKLNGKTVSASQFKTAFSDLSADPKQSLIHLKVHKNTPMGLVRDVEGVFREYGSFRINYSTVRSNNPEPDEAWRSKIDSRNILDLYINSEGHIIINENRTSLSSAIEIVRKFITNNGESVSLSESPQEAIVAIRTDKNTPYDTYTSTIEKVLQIYDELRDQASMELFDNPFKSLEEGSKERTKIKNMYPKRISIKDPSRS